MMKRWWMLAVLVTLALSLTSCSSHKNTPAAGLDYGYVSCQGTLGSFEIYITPAKADSTLFELTIIPDELDAPGDIVKVTLTNYPPTTAKEVVPQIVLNNGEEIFGGNLTENDLQVFNKVAITPFTTNSNFFESTSDKEAICDLPQPGEGADN